MAPETQDQTTAPRRDRRDPRRDRRVLGGRRLTDLAAHEGHWVTVRQIADYYGCPDRKVREWINAGLLPATNPSGKRMTRVQLKDLVEFDQRQRVRPKAS